MKWRKQLLKERLGGLVSDKTKRWERLLDDGPQPAGIVSLEGGSQTADERMDNADAAGDTIVQNNDDVFTPEFTTTRDTTCNEDEVRTLRRHSNYGKCDVRFTI